MWGSLQVTHNGKIHSSKGKTVEENLKLGSALLSRFDLIFILLDKPNAEMDRYLSSHVVAVHAGKKHSGTLSFSKNRISR
jgi:DNA helicase MCM8